MTNTEQSHQKPGVPMTIWKPPKIRSGIRHEYELDCCVTRSDFGALSSCEYAEQEDSQRHHLAWNDKGDEHNNETRPFSAKPG